MLRTKNHDFRNRNPIRSYVVPAVVGRFSLILFTGLVLSSGVFARGYSAAVTPAGATFGIKFASNGTPLATIGGTAGAVGVSQAVSLALPGAVLPVVASAAISGAQVAGAWGAAAAVLGVGALYALPAIKSYMDSKGISPSSSGGLQKTDPSICTVAPCNQYSFNARSGWSNTVAQACIAELAMAGSEHVFVSVNGLSCYYSYDGGATTLFGQASTKSVPASTAAYAPITTLDASNLLTAASPTIAVVQALVDLNFPPETTQKTTTGPASVFKGNVVSLGLDGSVTEILSRYEFDYMSINGEVKWVERTLNTVTPPLVTTGVTKAVTTLANGNTSTVTTTTTTTTPKASPGSGISTTPKVETNTQTVVTSPDGKVVMDTSVKTGTPGTVTAPVTPPVTIEQTKEEAKDPCLTSPLRVGCIDVDTPEGEIPKDTQTITFAEESVFGSGSCPANLTASLGLLGQTVTVWDWQKTCEMALPLRAIVLALASFAAFLIVMPGDNRT